MKMKRFILTLAMVAFLATGASAFELVLDDQTESQGAAFNVNPSTGLSVAGQTQNQVALGLATPGDIAANLQYQQNQIVDGDTQGVAGNFTAHSVNLNQEQLSGGAANGGIYLNSNEQQNLVLIGTANTGPQQAFSGQGILVNQETAAGAQGGAISGAGSSLEGQTAYTQQSSTPTGITSHFGVQNVDVQTGSAAIGPGPVLDVDQTTIAQGGATYTTNNGLGTQMDGNQIAVGAVIAQSDGSSGFVNQTHGYSQQVVNGGYGQTQTGIVFTQENL